MEIIIYIGMLLSLIIVEGKRRCHSPIFLTSVAGFTPTCFCQKRGEWCFGRGHFERTLQLFSRLFFLGLPLFFSRPSRFGQQVSANGLGQNPPKILSVYQVSIILIDYSSFVLILQFPFQCF